MIQTENWVPTDGDTFITEDSFIFNTFGYQHPPHRVFSFLKYIPAKFKPLFQVPFLQRTWRYRGLKLFRPERLYTPENYQTFLKTLRTNFPNYVYYCPFREKEVISVPLKSIKKIYDSKECLDALKEVKDKDPLQKKALNLIELLSSESNIPPQDFGIHGSIALNMHTPQSDIDLVIYGAQNFRTLEKTIHTLVEEGPLSYVINNRLDAARLYKGRYSHQIFMYNAVRKPPEITSKYGTHKYSPVKHVKFHCIVENDNEAMFRPAIYHIGDYHPTDSASEISKDRLPTLVVSMIGCYRNIAKQGSKIEVAGTLEKVENIETGKDFHQVVVGTGRNAHEYVLPI